MLILLQSDPGPDTTLVVGLVVFAVLAAVAGGVVVLALRLQRQREALAPLARLEAIEGLLRQLSDHEGELDLRRLEHVLIDLRDGQRRLEDRLLRLLESRQPGGASGGPVAGLGERVTTRLLALGYERIEILSEGEELEAVESGGEGEVRVEARRGGALHKGRVRIEDGTIRDVRLRDSYEAFP